ncbi:MAG: hypothetical protein KJ718_04350 [Nanoarchaeota archaeon]|nr:hypothetical protein [Nanoarchaeota archaeon]MBU1051760.1 hypothetical protein [Nanoarchaeota archaeon]MBU1988359.1 hypothetical protein [Nanoarchaeota archaeon]
MAREKQTGEDEAMREALRGVEIRTTGKAGPLLSWGPSGEKLLLKSLVHASERTQQGYEIVLACAMDSELRKQAREEYFACFGEPKCPNLFFDYSTKENRTKNLDSCELYSALVRYDDILGEVLNFVDWLENNARLKVNKSELE